MTRIRCFVLAATGLAQRALRRYSADAKCASSGMGYHNASTPLDEVRAVKLKHGRYRIPVTGAPTHRSRKWPARCACGYAFARDDEWQVSGELLYKRGDTGERTTLRDAQVGALWRATWLEEWPWATGMDGHAWYCRTPGGHWHIDGPASNCTMPDDHVHNCWCRHGIAPDFTVDKHGLTCAAGAGSILCGGYHGFLRAGYLEAA